MNRYLLVGCGYDRGRRIDPLVREGVELARRGFSDGELYTLDSNADCKPDVIAYLDQASGGRWELARGSLADRVKSLTVDTSGYPFVRFADSSFDEIHAYEVLEHIGVQGSARSFFGSFEPIYHALKPDGFLCGTVPSIHSPWLWADPGHRRVITAGTLSFLDRAQPLAPPSSDYRDLNRCDFKGLWSFDDGANLAFVLQAVKPAREYPR